VYAAHDAWPTWVLGSHDIPRIRTRLGRDEAARAAAVLLLTLRGTAFVYAGDELGLEDAEVPPELVQDPAGFRDGCRAPIPWEPGPDHGWASSTPWLPWPPDADRRNAAVLRDDPASILHLVRRAVAARAASPALREGDMVLLPAGAGPADVVAWSRTAGDDHRVVAVNFVAERREWTPPAPPSAPSAAAGDGWVVALSSRSADREGQAFDGVLEADEAVVLRPA
ncbi:MAG TPA: alpha-amylase family glycosyl hydrolase, partial [Acidimicrobiales bacterium]